ncbi:MAG: phosphatidylglycerophosphatase A [Alphaproteobacteria bacterium]|nr:phosphatidylglycerophosphatase A [Alphaproteobacteria bacterium]
MKKGFSFTLATFFNVGYSKIAPGTFGSLATLPLAYFLANFYGIWGIGIAVFVIFVIGTMATTEVLRHTPHDPGFVVIDEVAGQLLTFVSVAPYLNNRLYDWQIYLAGFILFRIFDILKPQPVRWADRKITNAWGVMLDDIIAGTYATLILYILFVFKILPF